MSQTQTRPNTANPGTVEPIVFSHPDDENRVVPQQLRGTAFPRFVPLPNSGKA
ncbi:hypothetical protein [Saccharothrix syringae]|uniref:hypothetical protein n=1 Tax=Saccharothrix syringae TaxID=103733 RepID=UPI000B05D5B5|nr:hypothetical protein [Saccharothrix syringae]